MKLIGRNSCVPNSLMKLLSKPNGIVFGDESVKIYEGEKSYLLLLLMLLLLLFLLLLLLLLLLLQLLLLMLLLLLLLLLLMLSWFIHWTFQRFDKHKTCSRKNEWKAKQNKANFFQEKKFVLFSKIFRAEAILGKSVFAFSKIQESHKFCFGGVLKKLWSGCLEQKRQTLEWPKAFFDSLVVFSLFPMNWSFEFWASSFKPWKVQAWCLLLTGLSFS